MIVALLLAAPAALHAEPLPLPAPAPVSMDYLAAGSGQVWVPAGNTGKVFVLDAKAKTFREVPGFATKKGRGDRLMGPSSVSLSESTAYVGNRGDQSVCAIDRASLEKKGCLALPHSPDGVFFVKPTNEVWVTTPRDQSIHVLDVSSGAPKLSGRIAIDGEPEGYAVDEGRGIVFTNLEDKDKTLAIDAKTRKVVATFEPGCGEKGPRGIALDAARGLLFVACTDAIQALDAKTGEKKGRAATGAGVDNIDYVAAKKLVYASAGQAEKLTLLEAADDGALTEVASGKVGKGCRVVVADTDGTAYAADSAGGKLWVAPAPAPAR